MSRNSEPSGMRCSNSDGHGFAISRDALSDLLIAAAAKAARRGTEGICAATLKWTIVVLRDGRRSRPWRADVAQLVAHHLAKVRVAGSNPVIRSRVQSHQPQRWSGRVVRQRPAKPCTRVRFPSPPPRFLGAISSAGERFPDTEEVTGSIPVSRTSITAVQRQFRAPKCCGMDDMWTIERLFLVKELPHRSTTPNLPPDFRLRDAAVRCVSLWT